MTIEPSGVVRWQPPGDLPNSQLPVSVRVEDARGGSAVQSFGVTVISPDANQPPVIRAIADQSVLAAASSPTTS
jgi:hypothetical protein